MMVGLAVGRDVHYVSPGSADGTYEPAHRAAKITNVIDRDKGIVDAVVFNPTGIHFVYYLSYDESKEKTYSWHWPERDE